MENNKLEQIIEEGVLEKCLLLTGMVLPATWFSVSQYDLMKKAGMYEVSDSGQYDQLNTAFGVNSQLASTAGALSLMLVGMYAGQKLGRFISRRIQRPKN